MDRKTENQTKLKQKKASHLDAFFTENSRSCFFVCCEVFTQDRDAFIAKNA